MYSKQDLIPDGLWMLDKVIALPLQAPHPRFNLESALELIGLDPDFAEQRLLKQLEAMSHDCWFRSPLLANQSIQERIALLAFNLYQSKRLYFHQANNRSQKYDFSHGK